MRRRPAPSPNDAALATAPFRTSQYDAAPPASRNRWNTPKLKSGGIQHTQQSGTCIVAGDTVFQFEEGLQEFLFGVVE